jgi:hypothetical protein
VKLVAAPARKQIEDRSQPTLHVRQSFARVPADELVDHRRVRPDRRSVLLELSARAGERQTLNQQQVLDPLHLFDVGTTVDPRPAHGLRDAQVGEFGLPRTQHIRLYLQQVADLGRLEERTIRNIDVSRTVRHATKTVRKYIKV